ncbi:putative membrane protein [Bacillus mycoides]|uniref:hypothetical protein n=1 Tax=Bacillus mycoides TaxID=1405 RepID=UPI0001A0441B|nr:hypothetical protein [Bacillus mycoides]AIW84348.1 putative membrane protein [Bacillus mycoides]EEL06146.1 hypothetical protein bcere0014_22430 [Bacillus cereus BDRD-ST196]
METFFWLLLSFGLIPINIFIIRGIQSQSLNTALERADITLCILTTIVCFLAGIIYSMYSNERKRKYVFGFSIIFMLIASCLSIILMIENEIKNHLAFNDGFIKYGMYVTFGFTVLLALISKYDEASMKDRQYGSKSREIDSVKIKGENFKL